VRHGSVHIIQIIGDVDLVGAAQLELAITRLAAAHPPELDTVTIDLTRAGLLAAAGTGALLAAAQACQGALTLRLAAAGPVLRALRLTGLHDYLAVHDTLDDALNIAQPAGPGQLRCAASAWPGYALVTVTGECDINTVKQFRSTLTGQETAEAARVIACMSGLRFLDSSGLQMLAKMHARQAGTGKPLMLVNPGPNVARLFEITGASKVFRIYSTLASAIAGS
jgi:anti-anti-sigma factor